MSSAMFQCPECGGTTLHECEIGPTITREVQRIKWQYEYVVYATYWISEDAKKWWVCGECGWKLPVETEHQLIAWLKEENSP